MFTSSRIHHEITGLIQTAIQVSDRQSRLSKHPITVAVLRLYRATRIGMISHIDGPEFGGPWYSSLA
jgi:hypothetical protein